jgi:molybdopterin-biosynthesis enzyme MoeA-like protein
MLAVGKELLIGRTLNTNAYWVGRRLARMGSIIQEITTVDDDLDEISSAFRGILRRSPDFLLVMGGLGPTPDDMTLDGISRGLGVRTKLNREALDLIRRHYDGRGLRVEMTPARKKMAMLPEGAEPIVNEVGTAPGVRITNRKTTVYCLPGVPVEMRSIFRRSVEPEIKQKLGRLHRKSFSLRLERVLESELAPTISEEIQRHPSAYIKSHPKGIREGVSKIELDIAVVGRNATAVDEEAQAVTVEMAKMVEKLGGTVASIREGAA